MSLATHVRTLGRGPGRARSLTRDEAQDAMRLMLNDAAPEAVGAVLMLLRMKGEVPEEIAGFAAAAQAALPDMPKVDLDWPSYAAGRTRGAPWFLRSAQIVAQSGHRVLLHGWNGADPKVRAGLASAGIGTAQTPDEAARLLDRDNIAYTPLEALHPALFRLLQLRDVLGLRSCINTICRMLNPAQAAASVQGVFHPYYRQLQTEAAKLLGWQNLTILKGGGGEFERNPSKDIKTFGLLNGTPIEQLHPALVPAPRRLCSAPSDNIALGNPAAFEAEIISGTALLAMDTIGTHETGAKVA